MSLRLFYFSSRAASRYQMRRSLSTTTTTHPPPKRPVVHAPEQRKTPNRLLTAGLPLILFSLLSAWVVSNALEGKNRERDLSRGTTSLSVRQANLQKEHDEMMDKLNTIVAQDFDNTKRVKRPEEILEERRRERERRNVWYRRLYRWARGRTE